MFIWGCINLLFTSNLPKKHIRQLPTISDCWGSKIAVTFLTPFLDLPWVLPPGKGLDVWDCGDYWRAWRWVDSPVSTSSPYPYISLAHSSDRNGKLSSILAPPCCFQSQDPWLAPRIIWGTKPNFSYTLRRHNLVSPHFCDSYRGCEKMLLRLGEETSLSTTATFVVISCHWSGTTRSWASLMGSSSTGSRAL